MEPTNVTIRIHINTTVRSWRFNIFHRWIEAFYNHFGDLLSNNNCTIDGEEPDSQKFAASHSHESDDVSPFHNFHFQESVVFALLFLSWLSSLLWILGYPRVDILQAARREVVLVSSLLSFQKKRKKIIKLVFARLTWNCFFGWSFN